MPVLPEEIFMEACVTIALDKNWIPAKKEHSLYNVPYVSTDTCLGETIGLINSYQLSPTGPTMRLP